MAGDLMQMAGILQLTLDYGNYNYFATQDMTFMIGAVPGTLDNYNLYEYRDDAYQEQVNKSAGFSQKDLYQDVDAYNISRIYDLSTTKFYVALDDYYNICIIYCVFLLCYYKKFMGYVFRIISIYTWRGWHNNFFCGLFCAKIW